MASVAEILLAQGQRAAETRRRMGEISAQKWQNLGNIAAGALQGYAQEREQAPIRAQQAEARELELKGLRDQDADRTAAGAREAQFQNTLASTPKRAKVLESLQGDEELYKRAAEHFSRMDGVFNRLLGEAAAGVRKFGDSPEVAMAAMDDLIEQGFDERKLEQFRTQIQQNPQGVPDFIDALLKASPDEEHKALVRPAPKAAEPFTLSQGQTRFNPDGTPIAEVAPKVEPEKTFTVTVRGPGGRPLKKVFTESELRAGVEEYREPKGPGAAPSRFWVMRDGQPVRITEAEYMAGDKPASTREQGRAVTSGDAGTLAELTTSLDDLKVLRETVAPIDPSTGKVQESSATGTRAKIGASLPNWVTELTGAGEDAKSKQAVIDRVKQVIGKALEGGVLRKEDEAKYEKILPTVGDTSAVVATKLQGLERAITLRRERQIDALEDAGYDVSKFRQRAPNATNQRVDDLLKKYGGG